MGPAPARATRVQGNILAAAERRLLTWLCARMPAWVVPDQLTALGFVGALLVFAGYLLSRSEAAWLWLSVAGYAINWFGDSLDGSLARYRRTERPRFGHFVDHSIDAFANMLGMVGLGLTVFVRLDVAMFALIGYLLLTVHVMLRMRATGAMQLSFAYGGPTELRLALVGLTLSMLLAGRLPTPAGISVYDAIVGGVAVILVVIFVWHTVQTATLLRREEG